MYRVYLSHEDCFIKIWETDQLDKAMSRAERLSFLMPMMLLYVYQGDSIEVGEEIVNYINGQPV